jgi:hypothetical protein
MENTRQNNNNNNEKKIIIMIIIKKMKAIVSEKRGRKMLTHFCFYQHVFPPALLSGLAAQNKQSHLLINNVLFLALKTLASNTLTMTCLSHVTSNTSVFLAKQIDTACIYTDRKIMVAVIAKSISYRPFSSTHRGKCLHAYLVISYRHPH